MAETVLITGMSGLIGGALRRRLGPRYALRALNRTRIAGVECHQADIGDLSAIAPAFNGADHVVHLAARAGGGGTWEDILHHNVIGTYNVFEAARRAGVKRVVYASSGATVSACERDEPFASLAAGRYAGVAAWPRLSHDTPPRPSGLYGVSKVWGEALARHFSDAHEMSMICLRIGAVNAEDRPLEAREYSAWLSQRDATRAFELALAAPPALRFAVCFVTSDNAWSYRDATHARDVLGFVPEDRAEDHR